MDLKDYKLPEKKKTAKFKFQDDVLEMAKNTGIPKELLFRCWTLGGYPLLAKIYGDFKEGAIKNPVPYILWKIKNWK